MIKERQSNGNLLDRERVPKLLWVAFPGKSIKHRHPPRRLCAQDYLSSCSSAVLKAVVKIVVASWQENTQHSIPTQNTIRNYVSNVS